MIKNIRHTGIVVDDLDSSIQFYQDLLGFRIQKKMEEYGPFINTVLGLESVKVTTVKMASPDGQLIELLKFHTHAKQKKNLSICDIGITHIALSVSNVNREYERLSKFRILFLSPPQTSPDGFAKVAFCQAPEGTYIELVEELGR